MTAGPRKLNSRVGFPATSWSLVNSAGRSESQCRDALESLCRGYWPPIYAELRRRNYSPSDAQDLTQEFFACLLRRDSFGSADRERGKFRSYLLGAPSHVNASKAAPFVNSLGMKFVPVTPDWQWQ